jgi:hypothetical protein
MIPLDKKYIIQNINYEFGWKKFMLLAILSALVNKKKIQIINVISL